MAVHVDHARGEMLNVIVGFVEVYKRYGRIVVCCRKYVKCTQRIEKLKKCSKRNKAD